MQQLESSPIAAIGIRIKNNAKICKQSTFAGKMGFFWAKIFGYSPIQISATIPDIDTVNTFAQQFVKNK